MNFSEALIELKNGKKTYRFPRINSYIILYKSKNNYFSPVFYEIFKDESRLTWLPIMADLLAEDWEIKT